MEDNRDDKARSALDRRKFLGALGATAAAGVFLKSGGRAEAASTTPPTPLYQNLYGNVVPVNPATLAAGIPAPPSQQTRPEGSGATYVTDAYAQPNFLLIMVDQMAAPRWLPAHMLTNISSIASQACYFPNYFPAATSCTPSRATLLTGLYSQQTCMFSTLQNSCEPQLLPYTQGGFPTIGDVLSQSAVGYDTVWIGKWHLSATGSYGNCGTDLTAGPSAYGFTDQYSVPNNSPTTLYTPTIPQVDPNPLAYPSPDGSLANEGSVGALQAPVEWPDPYPYPSNQSDYPPYQATNYVYQFSGTIGSPPAVTQPTYLALGDGAIASMFEAWLSHAEEKLTTTPWFCAVSFVNPHDMTTFPYGFGITPSTENMGTFNFPTPIPESLGYTPPPTTGYTGGEPAENVVVFPSPVPFAQGSSGPTGPNSQPWNCVSTDSPKNLQYGTAAPHGKPTLQYWYQNEHYSEVGAPGNTNAWLTFLNYYYWLQINVDYQVGQVMNALNGSESFNSSNTIVIFTSDHGDYSGSHYLPGKGWGLYDESINVPLYIRMLNQTSSQRYPYACSSVDILPFLYDMALGNYSWRSNPSDIVEYLGHREVIRDFIYSMSPVLQQRLSNIPWANPGEGFTTGSFQPYILHTTDEGFNKYYDPANNSNQIPGHAIAFRTVDYSTSPAGGGKLGVYSCWNDTAGDSDEIPPTKPDTSAGPQQFEFYYLYPSNSADLESNYGELGNQYWLPSGTQSTESETWQNAFGQSNVQNQLYAVPSAVSSAYATALTAYLTYVTDYREGHTPIDTTWQT